MTSISIIGSGNMARAIGTRAAEHGHTVEVIGRDAGKARSLAERIGHGTTVGTYGNTPAGEIVVVAILFQHAVDVITEFGDSLAGKTLVDITNPFNADASGVVTTSGDSMSDRIAAAAPSDAHVVKAFNTILGGEIEAGGPLDAFYAGDDQDAKMQVGAFLGSLGMQPRDAGARSMTHALEWAGILLVGVANNGAGFNASLKVEVR